MTAEDIKAQLEEFLKKQDLDKEVRFILLEYQDPKNEERFASKSVEDLLVKVGYGFLMAIVGAISAFILNGGL